MDFSKEQREKINAQVQVVKKKMVVVEKANKELRDETDRLKAMASVSGGNPQQVLDGVNALRGEWYEHFGEAE